MDKKDKSSKKQKKEQELLDFVTDLQRNSQNMEPKDTIAKLLDKVPTETESETLKVILTFFALCEIDRPLKSHFKSSLA